MARSFFPPAQVAKVAALLESGARPDAYRLIGPGPRTIDARGGPVTSHMVVEEGSCLLAAAGASDGERATLARLGWSSGYVVDLPLGTLVTPSHAIEVNGRRMEIGRVETPGAWALGVRVYAQERGGA